MGAYGWLLWVMICGVYGWLLWVMCGGVQLVVGCFLLLPSVWQAKMSLQSRLMCLVFRNFTTLSSSVDVSSCGASASVSTVVLLDVAQTYIWCFISI